MSVLHPVPFLAILTHQLHSKSLSFSFYWSFLHGACNFFTFFTWYYLHKIFLIISVLVHFVKRRGKKLNEILNKEVNMKHQNMFYIVYHLVISSVHCKNKCYFFCIVFLVFPPFRPSLSVSVWAGPPVALLIIHTCLQSANYPSHFAHF